MDPEFVDYWKGAPPDRLEAFLGVAPFLFLMLDAKHRIIKVSDRWADVLGQTTGAMEGQPLQAFLTPDEQIRADGDLLPGLVEKGILTEVALEFQAKDGTTIPVLMSATVMLDDKGAPTGSVAIIFDNRPVKDALTLLKKTAQEFEEASRAKSRFLAAMSHEIRTPMNAIMGFAQLLKLSKLDGKRRSHVDAILSAGGSLMNLLTDLLDLSQVEEGRMRIETRDVELIGLIDQIAEWWHSSAKQKGLRLNVMLDRALPRVVRTDPVRIQQVINNFLSNAVKFAELGSVTLRALVMWDDVDRARLRFEVEDTGPGMQPEQIENLFKPFVQIESDFGKDRGGWGLGLSICSNIAQRMGADIDVQSEPHEGSVFSFEIELDVVESLPAPRLPDPEVPDIVPALPPDSGCRVLLAEDNALNQEMMRSALTSMGHKVDTVANGFEAVEATIKNSYDFILMDIMMPGLDGISAAAQIRSADNPLSDIPIVACSAHVAEEARDRYKRVGMDAFVPKPIDQEELRKTIDLVMQSRNDDQPAKSDSEGAV